MSFFSKVKKSETTTNNLNSDLKEISKLPIEWKMSFNPDPSNQAQEVMFSRKITKVSRPGIFFNIVPVSHFHSQKHLGLILDSKLASDIHIKSIMTKVNKTIGLIKKFQRVSPRASFVIIYKAL